MHINTISINYRQVYSFLSGNEIYSPGIPAYKRLQQLLVADGWIEDDNHQYHKGVRSDRIKLGFTHSECDFYEFGSTNEENRLEFIKRDRSRLSPDDKRFLEKLVTIFTETTNPDTVEFFFKEQPQTVSCDPSKCDADGFPF